MYGKSLRLARLIHNDTKRTCIVPMDHGTIMGSVDGIRGLFRYNQESSYRKSRCYNST